MTAMAHTGAARAAVEALGLEYARAWQEQEIAVVSLAIGRFDTVPLQRLGTMDEFAWTVALLASPLGRSFNGSVVTLDGNVDNWHGAWPPPS